MKKVLIAAVLFGSLSAMASDQYCYDESGGLIDIPDGKKLVLVPSWWQVKDIYKEHHGAMAVGHVEVVVKECDSGELVISPGSCPQVVQPPEVSGVQCDSGVLVISPSTCPAE